MLEFLRGFMRHHNVTLFILFGILLFIGGCQPIATPPQPIIQPSPAPFCTVTENGTTFPALIESAKGKMLILRRVVIGDEIFPEYVEGQRLEFRLNGDILGSDGCNIWSFLQQTSPEKAKIHPFLQTYIWGTTLMYCADSSGFGFPLRRVTYYEKCGDEYWLYYGETPPEPLSIMVFALSK